MKISTSTRAAALTRLAILAASGGAVAAIVTPAPALAATAHHTSFRGTCWVMGTPSNHGSTNAFEGHGVCAGSLNGGPRTTYQVSEVLREQGVFTPSTPGLAALPVQASGVGTLTFEGGAVLRFAVQRQLSSFTVEGATDGVGSGKTQLEHGGAVRQTMTTCGTALAG